MIRRFSHSEFLPLEGMVGEKQRQGLSITLVIPARNEEATIGAIVSGSRRALMDEVPLVDEIVVIDGGSTDRTSRRASDEGAKVYGIDDTRVGERPPQGKGTALWRSLFVSTGDIIVCIDADIVDFDPRFVYGLIGPLGREPGLCLVKGFYSRPLEAGGVILDNEGGRVTEILVRPFLATFYPELAELIQPLAGECGFRRDAIETVPFFSGYGVEIGLVLDVYRARGLSCFAQVDMGTRRHRNRSVRELGKMAFGILQAMLKKLEQHKGVCFETPLRTAMISPGQECGYENTVIEEIELPCVADFRTGR
jgi:glucosyl-3-phosphoglycerate synthase